ncbi:MAG: hypothetical protein K2L51_06525, partial [Clostridiales bacterium]|nr:hypothetical protein [Clostridiales bacterium]
MEQNTNMLQERPSQLAPQTNACKDWCYNRFIKPFKKAGACKSIIFAVVFVLFAVYAASIIVSFLWMLLNSFKDVHEFGFHQWSLKLNAGFRNYADAFRYTITKEGEEYAV